MASQVPTNVSTYFYDASCIALSFSDPSSAYFNNAQPYYYIASAVDTLGNKTTYATGYKSPIYIQGLSAGYTYNCSLYIVQTASSDSIAFTTLSYPTISDISLSDVSFNFINLKWTATDVSYVKVTRRVGTLLPYVDICGGDYASPYYDSDISGNTTYYYYITPYMTKYGPTTVGSLSSVVSRTTPVAYPTDVTATFYDTSAIKLSFTAPKNTYTSVAPSYTAKAVYGGNVIAKSGTSPILLQNLSSGTTYTCYILTYFDSALQSTSNGLSVSTSSILYGPFQALYYYSSTGSINQFNGSLTGIPSSSNTGGSQSQTFTTNNLGYSFMNGTYTVSCSYYDNSSPAWNWLPYGIGSGYTTGCCWMANGQYSNPGVYTYAITGSARTTSFYSSGVLTSLTGEWIQYKLPYYLLLSGHGFRTRSQYWGCLPNKYAILGSTDGNTWYNIVSYESQGGNYIYDSAISYTYTMCTTPYNYFRMVVNSTVGNQSLQINQWNLTGYAYASGGPI